MNPTMKRLQSSTRANGRGSKGVALAVAALAGVVTIGSTAAAANGITIEKPWLRFIIKGRPAGGYFTLRNDTDRTIELTGASSIGCGMVMLHQSKNEGGVDKMLPVKTVTVPAHGTLNFRPGSYHLMCMHPQSTVAVGGAVPIALKFADGKTISADFPVKGPGG
ncbi:MAG: copper chaperone PCu(A)C [Bradyrhizobium sp.]|uniref:copper chaperone PCu(A)C n=1 Tax=Bradyrhizobium sp. TaxID=376 RepID=UPI001C284C98|nr:copper chaperone PCu(A)C [Bradyrhizobium sp.]MBU6464955.1 copper chaperone PCu(A)C [Pseudomonadota bacterium]MDE2068857.1 copper chaperone PCu(A)C [Bradyrhizobium sp.]MDE2244297.1 copper chaperone PCu(A)C [Bradyrhizobium sp.]